MNLKYFLFVVNSKEEIRFFRSPKEGFTTLRSVIPSEASCKQKPIHLRWGNDFFRGDQLEASFDDAVKGFTPLRYVIPDGERCKQKPTPPAVEF
ncbi:MAG: hypothetical protein HWE22_16980 [Flavobacteriales bacterium]|nr:hypothetical protein [Flavobacteriales bacterium]